MNSTYPSTTTQTPKKIGRPVSYSVSSSPFMYAKFCYESIDRPTVMFTDADQDSATGALGGREAYFYHCNPRGDVYALSNETGDIVERYDYSLYGDTVVSREGHNTGDRYHDDLADDVFTGSFPGYTVDQGQIEEFNSTTGFVKDELVGATITFDVAGTVKSFVINNNESFEISPGVYTNTFIVSEDVIAEGVVDFDRFHINLSFEVPQPDTSKTIHSATSTDVFDVGENSLVCEPGSTQSFTTDELVGSFLGITVNGQFRTYRIIGNTSNPLGGGIFDNEYTIAGNDLEIIFGPAEAFAIHPEILPGDTKSAFGNPHQWGGAWKDYETGMHYMRFRYYDSRMRRFISRDPMGYDVLGNHYQAFNNNAGTFTDPMGLLSERRNEILSQLFANRERVRANGDINSYNATNAEIERNLTKWQNERNESWTKFGNDDDILNGFARLNAAPAYLGESIPPENLAAMQQAGMALKENADQRANEVLAAQVTVGVGAVAGTIVAAPYAVTAGSFIAKQAVAHPIITGVGAASGFVGSLQDENIGVGQTAFNTVVGGATAAVLAPIGVIRSGAQALNFLKANALKSYLPRATAAIFGQSYAINAGDQFFNPNSNAPTFPALSATQVQYNVLAVSMLGFGRYFHNTAVNFMYGPTHQNLGAFGHFGAALGVMSPGAVDAWLNINTMGGSANKDCP